jgi:hypothetical protein
MKRNPRLAVVLGAVALVACGSADSPPPPELTGRLTVVVAVVDSLMPHEITAGATPRLAALKAAGTFYEQSRSVFIAETIPNHVAMMTGVYPSRSGIFSNDYLDFSVDPPEERDLSAPEKLTANTLFTWIDRQCGSGAREVRTGATLSKKYLFEVFAGDAADPDRANADDDVFNVAPDSYWDPESSAAFIPDPSAHTPDVPTMDQALTQLPDADFLFINLGDVDRLAHASGELPRAAALATADAQIGRLVDQLTAAGRWSSTVLIVLSDHGMDYSPPGPLNAISTQATLDALGACHEPMQAIVSGEGSESIFVLDRFAATADKQAALRAARACLLGTQDCATLCPGAVRPAGAANIATAWYNADDPADAAGTMPASVRSRHPEAGDLVLAVAEGYKFAEPDVLDSSGQIPGNHGHPATLHNTVLVSGGSPWVKQGVSVAPSIAAPAVPTTDWYLTRLPEQAETIDVAPTVAWLLGLGIRNSDFPDYAELSLGFDGRVLSEAFGQFDLDPAAAPPTRCGRY